MRPRGDALFDAVLGAQDIHALMELQDFLKRFQKARPVVEVDHILRPA